MKRADFYYELPAAQIAQEPMVPRDHSKLMVVDRQTGRCSHHSFFDIVQFLRSGDVLVLNNTKVFPARLRGVKKSGGKIELLLLNSLSERTWRALVRGAMRPTDLQFPKGLEARMKDRLNDGEWVVEFSRNHLRQYLDEHGEMPLPPYIKRANRRAEDLNRYQTVYAHQEGAVAAPTAGFHFTPEVLEAVLQKGVEIHYVLLHVGWGTFRPVRTETIEDHRMLSERFEVSEATANALNKARSEKRRVIAVGTTVTRTLESIVSEDGRYVAGSGESSLFIYPGYRFRGIDALITNFHLPDSTPLLLACAFKSNSPSPAEGGRRNKDEGTAFALTPALSGLTPGEGVFSLRREYEDAIRTGYRFYSYGDAMFIS